LSRAPIVAYAMTTMAAAHKKVTPKTSQASRVVRFTAGDGRIGVVYMKGATGARGERPSEIGYFVVVAGGVVVSGGVVGVGR
jgi:hypothetical protein